MMPEFFIPGTFDTEPPDIDPHEAQLHQGGLDQIDPAYDSVHRDLLAGAIGFDPNDLFEPSGESQLDIERELPQWGPPFVRFVDERITHLEKAVERAIEQWSFQTRTDVIIASMNTNASGGIDIQNTGNAMLYEPPPGFTCAIHRFSIVDISHNLGTPYTNNGSWWEARVNGDMIFGNSMVSGQGQLPVFTTWGTRDAPRVRDGEVLHFFMSGGPVSTQLKIRMQISLDRTIEG